MAFKRLEVHLRSNFPTEASLRDEMSHIEDVYGGKTDFIKQRVLLGYALLKESLEGVDGQDSLAIARVAQTLSQGHDAGSRVERAVMTFARILRASPDAEVHQEAEVSAATDVVAAAVSIVASLPVRGADESEGLQLDASAAGPAPQVAELGLSPAETPETDSEKDPNEAVAPARTNRWAHLRGLSGDPE